MKNIKKIVITILLLAVITIGILMAIPYFSKPSDGIKLKKNDNVKLLLVKVLVMDKEKTPKSLTMDSTFEGDKYLSSILYSNSMDFILKKNNNYYILDLKPNVNKEVLNNMNDYSFAMNNNNGETIKDVIFDKKNYIVKIPKKYFEQEKAIPVQMEIQTRLTKKELVNLPVKVKVKNIFAHNKTITLKGNDDSTIFTLFGKKTTKKLSDKNLNVYVNEYTKTNKLNELSYSINKSNGSLTVYESPVFLTNIYVDVNKNLFDKLTNMLFISKVKAYIYADANDGGPHKIRLASAPSFTITKKHWYATDNANIYYSITEDCPNGPSTSSYCSMDHDIRSKIYWAWKLKDLGDYPTNVYDSIASMLSGGKASYNTTLIEDDTVFDDPGSDSWGNLAYAKIPLEFYDGPDNGTINQFTTYKGKLVLHDDAKNKIKNQYMSMSCVHITTASNATSLMPLWAYVFDYQAATNTSDGYMDVMYVTSDNVSTQTLYGVVRYYWPAEIDTTGYIKITKVFDKNVRATDEGIGEGNANPSYIFHAQATSSTATSGADFDNRCKASFLTGTDYDTKTHNEGGYKIIEHWPEDPVTHVSYVKKVIYYLGIPYNSGIGSAASSDGDPKLNITENASEGKYNKYCIWETFKVNDEKYVTWDEPRLSNVNDSYKGTIVRVSSSSETSTVGGSSFKVVNVSATNRRREYCVRAVKTDKANKDIFVPNVTFGLYSNSSCTTPVKKPNTTQNYTETTNSKGAIRFEGLTNYNDGYYWIKEENSSNSSYHLDTDTCTKLKVDSDGDCETTSVTNQRKYYCAKVVKKDAATGANLAGATFTSDRGKFSTDTTTSDSSKAVSYIYAGTSPAQLTITETAAPSGFNLPNPRPEGHPTPALLKPTTNGTPAEAKTLCLDETKTDSQKFVGNSIPATAVFTFNDSKNILNWYKETEGGTGIGTAKFKVYYTDGQTRKDIVVSSKENYTIGGVTKSCYKFSSEISSTLSSPLAGSELEANTNGDVCITGLTRSGSYTVKETKAAQFHTFDGTDQKNINSSTTFVNKVTSNKFINKPTEVKIIKKVEGETSETDELTKAINNAQINKLKFNIKDTDGNIYFFIKDQASGKYVYYWRKIPAGNEDPEYRNTYDLPIANPQFSDSTKDLILNSSKEIEITHLPKLENGKQYIVSEYGATVDNENCICTDGANECVPFYHLKSETKFTVTDCSSEDAKNLPACSGDSSKGKIEVTITNKLTELVFTKKDLYRYNDESDVANDVEFEDDNERSDFDRIVFKVYRDSDTTRSTPLRFISEGNNESNCLLASNYSIYRYVPDDIYEQMSDTDKAKVVTELHTCGGHIKIIGLCRGQKFVVVEDQVPDGSVYVLEVDQTGKKPEIGYSIPCCDTDKPTVTTTTTVIKDTPTRVRIEKRDNRNNFLIDDETTTFQLYRCNKGEEDNCHPSQSTDNMTLVKFHPRKVLTYTEKENGQDVTKYDKEDGKLGGHTNDYENTYEVYTRVSDSDAEGMPACSDTVTTNCYVTDLHTDHGVLILRYLQSGYTYKLLETGQPKKYTLPEGQNKETKIEVVNNTANVEPVDYPNIPTSLLVRKYNEDGTKLLEGAEFKLYKATTCTTDVAPKNLVGEVVKLRTDRDGLYQMRLDGDTEIFKTCTDRDGALCSGINDGLTHDNYKNTDTSETFGDYTNVLNSEGEHPVIQAGEALIEYLDYGCYVIEEVKAPKGYKLPENENDRFIYKEITNKQEVVDTFKELLNKPTNYTFYKLDEYNKPLDGAKFKLQKLNSDKKYEDVPVTMETGESGKTYYRVDDTSTNYIIETVNGEGTVYYLSEGQYRILEVVPPEGYELPAKSINAATFVVDEDGQIFGGSVITNKPKTEKINAYAEAKLIINIQTGQTILKYGLIIAIIVIATCGLIYIQRKKK